MIRCPLRSLPEWNEDVYSRGLYRLPFAVLLVWRGKILQRRFQEGPHFPLNRAEAQLQWHGLAFEERECPWVEPFLV